VEKLARVKVEGEKKKARQKDGEEVQTVKGSQKKKRKHERARGASGSRKKKQRSLKISRKRWGRRKK